MRQGDEWPAKSDLSSLRLLGTVGEPINPEAWIWYHRVIGGGAARSWTPGGRPRRARS
jgi:acetyl-CoA synthetase